MSKPFDDIEKQALQLTAEERARLAEVMLESLHKRVFEIEAAWAEEIEKRVSAYDRGEFPAYAAEDVFAEARHLSR